MRSKCVIILLSIFFSYVFKQKATYEMRISDWSSDVCSSDLPKVLYARVLNAEQIDGLEPYKAPEPAQSPVSQVADIFYGLDNTVRDAVTGRLTVTGLGFVHDQQDRAFYDPVRDNIHMPEPQLFKSDYEYAATADRKSTRMNSSH